MTSDKKCLHCSNPIPSYKRSDSLYCSNYCGERYRGKRFYRNNLSKMYTWRYRQNQKVEQRILSRVKSRAKKLGIPFDLDAKDIEVVDYCPVLGIELVKKPDKQGYSPNSLSLDRIYPERGYVKGNVRVISARANLLKNDATIEELELVLRDLKELWGG